MTLNPEPLQVRLSPSGPLLGNPPSLQGGGNGVTVSGRCWRYQGSGQSAQVPGTLAGDVTGLTDLQVDLLPAASGYKYDIEVDVNTYGTGGQYEIIVLASNDGGATYGGLLTTDVLFNSGSGRLHIMEANPTGSTINRLKVQLLATLGASAALTYEPQQASIRVTEYSAS